MSVSNPFSARWTAQGHNICLGRWEVRFHRRGLPLPAAREAEDMGTRRNFSYLYPDDDEFIEGLDEDDWLLANVDWLAGLFGAHGIPVDEHHMRCFYRAVNEADWRCGSCGGCI